MTILQALNARYDRLADRGDLPPYGYSTVGVSFGVVLSADGEPVHVHDLRRPNGKRMEAKPIIAPEAFGRSGISPLPYFLWDNSKFTLGIGLDKKKNITSFPGYLERFKELHNRLLAGTDDTGLLALLRFLDLWTEERFQSAPFNNEMREANIAFMLDGDIDDRGMPRFLHDLPAARRIWERQKADISDENSGICLVTGMILPIARLHPQIKGVSNKDNKAENMTKIVSFEQKSFQSYNKKQGDNAPLSEIAAFKYGAALNGMLARDSGNRMQIADATTVFWADSADTYVERVFSFMSDPPPEPTEATAKTPDLLRMDDDGETQKLQDEIGRAHV